MLSFTGTGKAIVDDQTKHPTVALTVTAQCPGHFRHHETSAWNRVSGLWGWGEGAGSTGPITVHRTNQPHNN